MNDARAFTGVEIALALVLLGGLGYFAFPKLFHKQTRLAAQSTEVSTKLEAATVKVDDAVQRQASDAAAGVVKLGEVTTFLADSPAKDFFRKEIPLIQSKLPAPNAMALLEAEKRRVAVMEGKLELATALYTRASERAAELQAERDSAIAERDAQQAARREVDAKLVAAAAAERAQMLQKFAWAGGLAVVAVLWILAQINASKLKTFAQSVIPTLDKFYESSTKQEQATLNEKIFDPLGKAMDQSTKSLVHKIRATVKS